MNLPFLIFSDVKGKIFTHPYLRMAVSCLDKIAVPKESELISLPKASSLFHLPSRSPLGVNPKTGEFEEVLEFKGRRVFGVGAFLIPAYLRLYNPAVVVQKKKVLPLWAYTACGFYGGRFYVAAVKIDRRVRQRPSFYNQAALREAVAELYRQFPNNRLYRHLSNCALNYNCLAAKNLFLRRWEAPLPTAQRCNARCIGCLSYQTSDCASSHKRISFRPTVSEVVEVLANHLKWGKEAIVSFGQGCEGEPLLEADLIASSVGKVRQKLSRGTINVNTNASLPDKVELLCRAGVDSFRVSINSLQKELYDAYFRPRNYKFSDIIKSIEIAKKYKKFVAINLFIFPGVSDSTSEIEALTTFLKKTKPDMVQLRNLNIDPQYYLDSMPYKRLKPQGIMFLVRYIQKEFPHVKIGYFNLPKSEFKRFRNIKV
ncbi:MAG: radical SAM protein [Candidatus Omnitrophota bacterium]|nr:MAG: radical SAM protein [Candidatus Omnitrophota bacterium]